MHLSADLRSLLDNEDSAPLSVGRIADRVGTRGHGLLLVVLSLPSALPVPAPGYSMPFGLLLLLIALQMLAGRRTPALPARLRARTISARTAQRMITAASRALRAIEWAIRPRLRWIGSRPGQVLMGALVLAMATLMLIPIPLTNTAPAMVIFLIGIGLSEEDGLFALGACLAGILATALYAAFVVAFILYGPEVVEIVRGWLGR
jgi:hypothetical protein